MEASHLESDPAVQRDVICAYLGRQASLWAAAKVQANRADGLSSNLNQIVGNHYRQIDALLDELIEVPGVRDGA